VERLLIGVLNFIYDNNSDECEEIRLSSGM